MIHKNRILCLIAFCCAAFAWNQGASAQGVNDNLVAEFTLNETSGTVVDNNVIGSPDGTLSTPTLTNWLPGKFNSGVNFEGTSATAILVPHDPVIDFADEDFTVAFWLKTSVDTRLSTQPEQTYLIKGSNGAPYSGNRYVIFSKGGAMRFDIDDNVTKSGITVAGTNFFTGDWVHVAAVRDTVANELRLYANGVLEVSGADATGSIAQNEQMSIGMYWPNNGNRVNAQMDEVRIYRRALNPAQIMEVTEVPVELGSFDLQ